MNFVVNSIIKKERLQALLVSLLFGLYWFFPFPFNAKAFPGPAEGDNWGGVQYWERIFVEGSRFSTHHYSMIGFPAGIRNPTFEIDIVSFFSTIWYSFVGRILNPQVAVTLLAFVGVVLTGFLSYVLCERLFSQRFLRFSGLIFGIMCPHILQISVAAATYTHGYLYLLPIIAVLDVIDGKSIARLVLACIPGLLWSPYFTEHVLIILLVSVVYLNIFSKWTNFKIKYLKSFSVFVLSTFVMLFLTPIAIRRSSVRDAVARPRQDFFDQGANILHYLIPPSTSRFWGQWLANWRETILSGPAGLPHTNLYLGVVLTAMTIVGIVFLKFSGSALKSKTAYLLSISIVAFLFSLPPSVSGVPTPSELVYQLSSGFRAGQRFGPVVYLSLIPLGVHGMSILVNKSKHRFRWLVGALLLGVAVLDLSIEKGELPSFMKELNQYDQVFPHVNPSPVLSLINQDGYESQIHFPFDFISPHPGSRVPCSFLRITRTPLWNTCELTSNDALQIDIRHTFSEDLCAGLLKVSNNSRVAIVLEKDTGNGLWQNGVFKRLLNCLNNNFHLKSNDGIRLLFERIQPDKRLGWSRQDS